MRQWFFTKPTSFASQLTTAIKEVDSPPDKLRNYIFVRMRAFAKLSNYYNAVFDKNLDHYEFIEKIRARYDREELAILGCLSMWATARGVFEVEDSEYTAMAIQTMLKGMEVPLFWRKREIDINNRLDAILNLIFYGINKTAVSLSVHLLLCCTRLPDFSVRCPDKQ